MHASHVSHAACIRHAQVTAPVQWETIMTELVEKDFDAGCELGTAMLRLSSHAHEPRLSH